MHAASPLRPATLPVHRCAVDLHERIEHNMTNHPPTADQVVERFELLRDLAKQWAHAVAAHVPECREQSLALTAAEESLMWAVAGVARNQ